MIKRYLIIGDNALKLYHLSRNIIKQDYFEPKIPKYSSKNESKEKRICLSSSIEGAISSTFYQWFVVKNNINDNGGTISLNNEQQLKFMPYSEALVYEFDTRNMKAENIIEPHMLKNYNVYDAEVTNEYWIINETITPIRSYLIKLIQCNYLRNFKLLNDWLHEIHYISNLEFNKIVCIDSYLSQIDKYYSYKKLNQEKDKIYFELITQILVRESDNSVTRLFLKKLKLMDENNMVSEKVSSKLEKEYFVKL